MILVLLQTPVPPDLGRIILPDAPFWALLPPNYAVALPAILAVAATVVLSPVMRAVGRRIERRREPDARLHARVAELEERLDFAGRVLPRPDAVVRVPGSERS